MYQYWCIVTNTSYKIKMLMIGDIGYGVYRKCLSLQPFCNSTTVLKQKFI